MAKRRRELTAAEWAEVGRLSRESIAALARVGSMAGITSTSSGGWATLRRKVERMVSTLSDRSVDGASLDFDLGLRPKSGPESYTPGACDGLGWPFAAAGRTRLLDRAEWIALGDEVKRARRALMDLAFAIQPSMTIVEQRTWHNLTSPLDRLKSDLENAAYRQHPRWPSPRLFYGDPLTDAERRAALDVGPGLPMPTTSEHGLAGARP